MDRELIRLINENYNVELPEIEPIYDRKGKIKNEKEIKQQLKVIAGIVGLIWLNNLKITNKYSKKVQTIVFTEISREMAKKGLKTSITKTEWNKIINKAMKDRALKVKIKQVMRGNARRLNKNIQKTVVAMYKEGKSKPQIAKALQEQFKYNKNKAKSIANTEINYYKSEAQINAIKGANVRKIWVYNPRAKEPRRHHMSADGQIADENGFFLVGGVKVEAPQHFGDPSEDVNCNCTMRIELIND